MTKIGHKPEIAKPIRKHQKIDANTNHNLDKYAQKCTSNADGDYRRDTDTFKHKARQKRLTQKLMIGMVNLDSDLTKSYWRTYNCCESLLQYDKKISFQRCKNRFCLDCNGYRTAKLINGYLHQIEAMTDPWFVTLSRVNCSWDDLDREISFLNSQFAKIRNWFRSQRLRGAIVFLDGLKKFEVTYSILRDDFHPHIHLIVDGQFNAYTLLGQWFRLVDGAGAQGQDVRQADPGSVKELFKYMTKFWKEDEKDNETIEAYNPEELDHIMKAMKGKQVFKSFGRIKKTPDVVPDSETLDVQGIKGGIHCWKWDKNSSDWINEYGEIFCDYKPNLRDQKIYNAIDRSQQI